MLMLAILHMLVYEFKKINNNFNVYNSQVLKTVLVLSFRIIVLCADLNLYDRISSVFNYTL